MDTLLKRTIFGLLFTGVVIGCLLSPWGLILLLCFLSVMLFHEFYRLTADVRFRKERVCIAAASVLALILLFFHLQAGWDLRYAALGLVPVFAAHVLLLFDAAKDHVFPTELYFPLLYVTLPLGSALFLGWPGGHFSWRLLMGLMTLIWLNDIGAYVVGMSFGQRAGSRKLFPALSPKKSWIGAVGGTAASFVTAWAVYATFGKMLPLVHWLALAAIVAVFGVFGDLFESLLKRHARVKDAGNFIPGHGGLLDRFDDVLFVFPLAAIYLSMFSLL